MARAASPRATVDRPGVVPVDGTGQPWALTGKRVVTPDGPGRALYCRPAYAHELDPYSALVRLDNGWTTRYPPRKITPEETR